ncbi:MAG TPA: SPOR domain-containing protein [Casimicrobium huifangae]|uniref:SPOR domain-containing protein n=1 Tax=Casimicrobium huifangae TaxID=2591109 RepID=UPI002BC2107F|nr:SPOR domain-containing protein [Casimicrobium huifangae]HQD65676.1 SPOR domain-containing protein [Casimicrobium huifangae]
MDTSPQNKTASFLFGGLIGFVVGLVVAGVLAIWIYSASPFRPETTPPPKLDPIRPKSEAKTEAKPTGQTGALAKDENKTDAERIVQPGSTPASTPAAPAANAAAKTPAKPADPEPSPSAEPRGRLWLQVGAYANKQDAENQRARFAMLGYEAKIESADVPDKGTVHRVRVGPYRDPDEAGKVRGDLARQGIEVTVVKP